MSSQMEEGRGDHVTARMRDPRLKNLSTSCSSSPSPNQEQNDIPFWISSIELKCLKENEKFFSNLKLILKSIHCSLKKKNSSFLLEVGFWKADYQCWANWNNWPGRPLNPITCYYQVRLDVLLRDVLVPKEGCVLAF